MTRLKIQISWMTLKQEEGLKHKQNGWSNSNRAEKRSIWRHFMSFTRPQEKHCVSSSRSRGVNSQRQTETPMENGSYRKPDTRKGWFCTRCKSTHQKRKTNRPITKLYPLELCNGSSKTPIVQTFDESTNIATETSRRAVRKAATQASQRIKDWVDVLRDPKEDVEK
jgi:hypothetical protein